MHHLPLPPRDIYIHMYVYVRMRVSIEASRKFQHGECRNAWNGNALFRVHSRTLSLLKRIITSHVVARDYSHTNYSTSNRRVEKENRADIFTGELIVLPNRGSDECWLWWMFRASGNVFVKNSLRPRSTFHSLRDVRPKFVSTREMENRNPDFSILPNELSTGNGRNGVYRILGIPTR